jgi:hypothetical protein
MWAVVALSKVPGAAQIFGFHPDMVRTDFGADDEERALAGRVQDSVGG